MIKVFAYGYHTIMVWAFSQQAVETHRAQLIKDWPFDHSPSTAMSHVVQFPLSEVEEDWNYVG